MKSNPLLSLSMMIAVGTTACMKKTLSPEAPKLNALTSQVQQPAAETSPAAKVAPPKPAEAPSVERIDEETARFVGSSARVIVDGKAEELSDFVLTSTVLVEKDDQLYQVKTDKALEIPALEIATVANDMSLDVEVDDQTEFSILATGVGDGEGTEVETSRCLGLRGDLAGLLLDVNTDSCWARRDQLSDTFKTQATERGFSLSLTDKITLEDLKRYPLLAVKVRSASSDRLPDISQPSVSAPAPVEEAKALVEDASPANPTDGGPAPEFVMSEGKEPGEPAVETVNSETKESLDPLPDQALSSPGEELAAVEASPPEPAAPETEQLVVAEATPVEDAPPVVDKVAIKDVIPVIKVPKKDEVIASLPVLAEAIVLQEIKADDEILLEQQDLPFEAKARREIWIEKSKQRLAIYKDKKHSFDDLKKERNRMRAERKALRQELTSNKKQAVALCALKRTRKEKAKDRAATLSDKCINAKATVANLEASDQDLTRAIAELKENLEAKKQEALDDLKLLKDARVNLKAVNLELKLATKK